MQADSAAVGGVKRAARSKVSNGSALLEGVDGRSSMVRRYRDILAALVSDLGGQPTEAQTIIVRRAATLAVWSETRETMMANGTEVDIGEFTTAVNALRRLLSDIGLERRMRDVTPSLATYMAGRADDEAGP
jgi:hypothetical protein